MQHSIVFSLFLELLSSDKVSAGAMAEKYEVSRRSILRYMDVLSAAGVPVVSRSGRLGGFSILPEYKIGAMVFSGEEFARLSAALDAFLVQDALTAGVKNKLSALFKNSFGGFLNGERITVCEETDARLAAKFEQLLSAAKRFELLEMTYRDKRGEQSVRLVEPYFLYQAQNVWYVFCFCRLRGDFRFFKLTRILELHKCGSFEPRKFDVPEAKRLLLPMLDKAEEIIFEVGESAADAVEEWLGVECLERRGKRLFAHARLPVDDFLLSHLMFFGTKISVLEPESLKERLKAAYAAALEKFKA